LPGSPLLSLAPPACAFRCVQICVYTHISSIWRIAAALTLASQIVLLTAPGSSRRVAPRSGPLAALLQEKCTNEADDDGLASALDLLVEALAVAPAGQSAASYTTSRHTTPLAWAIRSTNPLPRLLLFLPFSPSANVFPRRAAALCVQVHGDHSYLLLKAWIAGKPARTAGAALPTRIRRQRVR
jgi:hypothetical protein